jgi:hypothetical protein
MSKIILIQAVPVPGFNGHGEAHRYWPSGSPVKVEVLDQEDDGPLVPVRRKRGEEEVVEMDHDMTVIGQRSYRAVKKNPRLRIVSDTEMIGEAEVSAAREEADKLRADNMALRADVSNLDAENGLLRAQLDEALKRLGEKPGSVTPPVQTGEAPPVTPGSLAPDQDDDVDEEEDVVGADGSPPAARRPPPARNRDAAKAAADKKK